MHNSDTGMYSDLLNPVLSNSHQIRLCVHYLKYNCVVQPYWPATQPFQWQTTVGPISVQLCHGVLKHICHHPVQPNHMITKWRSYKTWRLAPSSNISLWAASATVTNCDVDTWLLLSSKLNGTLRHFNWPYSDTQIHEVLEYDKIS